MRVGNESERSNGHNLQTVPNVKTLGKKVSRIQIIDLSSFLDALLHASRITGY